MAQLAVAAAVSYAAGTAATAAGIAAGTTFLGMTAAGWGWMVGSIVGSMIFAPGGEDGPRVQDGKFSSNAIGQPIPLNFGTHQHGAQILWWSGLIEDSEEVGGKGGGGARQFSYSCNVLLSACEGPQAAVLQVKANGRIIATFNGVDFDVDEELLQPGSVRAYLGTEDQGIDPTYQAAVGDAAIPYRGEVIVAIDGLQLAFSGNRPPNFEVIVAQDVTADLCPDALYAETAAAGEVMYAGSNGTFGDDSSSSAYDPSNKRLYIASRAADKSTWQIEEYDATAFPPALAQTIALPSWAGSQVDYAGLAFDPDNGMLYVFAGGTGVSGDWGKPFAYLLDNGVLRESRAKLSPTWGDFDDGTGEQAGNGGYYGVVSAIYPDAGAPLGEVGRWSETSAYINYRLFRLRNGSQGDVSGRGWYDEDTSGRWHESPTVYYVPKPWGINIACRGINPEDAREYIDDHGTVTEISGRMGSPTSASARVCHSIRRARGYIMRGLFIAQIDLDNPTAYATPFTEIPAEVSFSSGKFQLSYSESSDRLIVFGHSADTLHVWTLDPTTYAVKTHCSEEIPADRRLCRPYYVAPGVFVATVTTASGAHGVAALRVPGGFATGNPVTLRSIIEAVCLRSELPAENLDATAATDLVAGFKVARQTSARAILQSLQPAYFFDFVESGTKLVVRKRGAAEVATIDAGDLGARVFQVIESEPAPAYEREHVEEIETPRVVEVSYVDTDAGYDIGVQRAERQTGTAKAPLAIEVPVVLTAAQAQTIAFVNLLHAHASKDRVKFSLPHIYDAIEPADTVLVPMAGGNRRVRIDAVTRARPMLECEGAPEERYIYEVLTGGSPRLVGPSQTDPATIADTRLVLLDIPPLRDEDDSLLIYVAMAGDTHDKGWSGASLYQSTDGGTSYTVQFSTSQPATIGSTRSALGNWSGGNHWDETSTVDVRLTSGTFSSATKLAVYNGTNAVAVGAEILQFLDAELIDTDVWRLSGLLRGRKGTAVSEHGIGETVVLLSSALRVHATTALGMVRHYKAVTAGKAVAEAPAHAFTLAGNSIRPLSPVHIHGSRDGDDLTITWIRRARINAEWRDLIDVPLDEPSEAYEIDILDGSTVVRTLTATTPSVVYSGAQQTTDFGAPQTSISIAVYQMSSRIGRGHAGTATI